MNKHKFRIKLLYLVLAALVAVGVVPLGLAGWMLSTRSGNELRAVEGRYQVQLVEDKARQIELYGVRYRDLVTGLARAFEINAPFRDKSDERQSVLAPHVLGEASLKRMLEDDRNLLALSIVPVGGAPLNAFQPSLISPEEVTVRSDEALSRLTSDEAVTLSPRQTVEAGVLAYTVAVPITAPGGEIRGAVVAVISLEAAFKVLAPATKGATMEALLDSGVPVLFVVSREGRALSHPDAQAVSSSRLMTDFKIVQEWRASGSQVESALIPFTRAQPEGREIEMLGSYSTARFGHEEGAIFGVIAVQDERRALTSVWEMRRTALVVSLIAGGIAVLIGFLMARQLAHPVAALSRAARRLAAGDFSHRLSPGSATVSEIGDLSHSFNAMTDRIEEHIAGLQRAAKENRELFLGTVKALAAAIDGKDPYTRGHSERVARFSIAIAERMGLPDDEIEILRISAILHDVGKIGIDDNILKKPAALTNEEYEIMKGHPQKGYKIMSQIPAMKEFLPGMYMHHEMLDGRGYPQGLKGEEIPMQARIVSVADSFDAMTTDRPYSKARSIYEAVDIIEGLVGTRYDGRVVAALRAACDEGQIRAGSVKLSKRPLPVS